MALPVPDLSTEEITIHAGVIDLSDMVDSLAPGEALRLLMRIEEESTPLARIPRLILGAGRLSALDPNGGTPPALTSIPGMGRN